MNAFSGTETAVIPVRCAWCGKILRGSMEITSPRQWSHGICKPCFFRQVKGLGKRGEGFECHE